MRELASPSPLKIPEPSRVLPCSGIGPGRVRPHQQAAKTLRSYRIDLADFQAWCEIHGLPALPASPTTVAVNISALAQAWHKVATIEHRLAALSQAHQLAGYASSPTSQPEVRLTIAGVLEAVWLQVEVVRELLDHCGGLQGPDVLVQAMES